MSEKRLLLRVLRLFYQGFRLITGGLKKEIVELEAELNELADGSKDTSDQT
jgi:hypothetical protein